MILPGMMMHGGGPTVTLTSVSPSLGDTSAGTRVTLYGAGFAGAASVTIGGVACTGVTVVSATQIDCIAPALSAGVYDVSLTIGTVTRTLSSAYEAWSPTEISGARVYDAEHGVTESGGSISQWSDRGSGARHVMQSTPSARPTYVANAIGYDDHAHVITFDGSEYLRAAAKEAFAAGKSVFFVARQADASSRFTVYSPARPVVGDMDGSVYGAGPGFTDGQLSAVNYVEPPGPFTLYTSSTTNYADGVCRLYGMIHRTDGTLRFYVGTSQDGADQTSAINTTYYGWDTIGHSYGGAEFLAGCDLCAVVVYNGELSATHRARLYQWAYARFMRGATRVQRIATSASLFSSAPKDGVVVSAVGSKLVAFGGWATTAAWEGGTATTTNEMYESSDGGATWTLLSAHVASPPVSGPGAKPRRRHTVASCMHNGRLYIIGGDPFDLDSGSYWRDVWAYDGTSWTRITASAAFSPRVLHMAWSYGGNIYVAGGQTDIYDPSTALRDIWVSSDDGATWSLHTSTAPWSARGMVYSPVVHRGRVWLIGGGRYHNTPSSRTYYNDVWSWDGTTWTEEITDGAAPWSRRQYHSVATHGGYIWIASGYKAPGANVADLWRSRDGVTWRLQRRIPWPATHAASLAELPDGSGLVYCGGIETGASVYRIDMM
jgi:N-acetylneuraminic acid mutarotase